VLNNRKAMSSDLVAPTPYTTNVHIQIQISPCTNSPKIPNIYRCVFVYVCLRLSLWGGEVQSICIYLCVTVCLRHSICHYVEIQISAMTELIQSST